jgi:hypothetical protein
LNQSLSSETAKNVSATNYVPFLLQGQIFPDFFFFAVLRLDVLNFEFNKEFLRTGEFAKESRTANFQLLLFCALRR